MVENHLHQELGSARGRRCCRIVWLLGVLPLVLLLAAGCRRGQIKVYRVAKDQSQTAQPTGTELPTDSPNPKMPPGHPDVSATSGAPQLTWKTPTGWTEEAPSEMRVASFKVAGAGGKQADVSVIPLPGMAGSDEANVNRWRGQVGLSPVADEAMHKAAEKVEAGGLPAELYDIAGTNPDNGNAERILGVIQHRPDGNSWFYKMTGDSNLVEQQKAAFIQFLKSLKFGATAPAQSAQTEEPASSPANGGEMGAMVSAAGTSSVAKPNWKVPADWKEVPAAQFLLAEYAIAGANGAKAEVNVAALGGDGGGLLANVNRWRRQIGLAPLDQNDLGKAVTSLEVTGGKADVVDMSGTDFRTGQPTRLVGVIVPMNGQTWFYKLMGDASVVAGQKAAFLQFVKGVKY